MATVTATVLDPSSLASISQQDGSVAVSGEQPLYCDQSETEIMCYY